MASLTIPVVLFAVTMITPAGDTKQHIAGLESIAKCHQVKGIIQNDFKEIAKAIELKEEGLEPWDDHNPTKLIAAGCYSMEAPILGQKIEQTRY